jgi:hypothetical protein
MTGIREYFASLQSDRDDEAWFQLAFVFEQRIIQHRELCREWRRWQPRKRVRRTAEQKRALARARKQRWLAANENAAREHARKWREANQEAKREQNRKWREKQKARAA